MSPPPTPDLDPTVVLRALASALELLPFPAMVFNGESQVMMANSLASALLQDTQAEAHPRIARALQLGSDGPWTATPLGDSGLPGPCLMTAPGAIPTAEDRIKAAAVRWRLSRRQREVLGLLAKGRSNKEIALALGCAVSTVEIHVSAVLQKSGVGRRAQLIALLAGG
ncbi:MAG: helix-turn-helix transcriptional regulator [Myxococcota bacterium]|nr:helix-turn-helix transcriptional regulator [Myxococcota bacterium]